MPQQFANEEEYKKWLGEEWEKEFEPLKLEPRKRPRICRVGKRVNTFDQGLYRVIWLTFFLAVAMFALVEMLMNHMNH